MAATGQLTVAAILVAAGDGTRLGANMPKAFVNVAGRTILEHATAHFADHRQVRDVVVVVPAGLLGTASSLVPGAQVVAGGPTRQDSVARGLAALADDVEFVLVHDVARPFVPAAVIGRVLDALVGGAAGVVPTLPVTDTIRRYDAATGDLGATVDRAALRAMQTPQGFVRSVLVAAHADSAGAEASDDAALVEALGEHVVSVAGDVEAFKITHPLDLALAEVVALRG